MTPHADPAGARPADAGAAATFDAQQRPENRWVLHPTIDGCVPNIPSLPPDGGLH